jgi:hypothetical protein
MASSAPIMKKKKNSAMRWSAGLVAILALALGYVYTSNPLLSGRTWQEDPRFSWIEQNDMLDAVLNQYASFFPTSSKHNELVAYKNHCLRVLTFTVHHYLNNTPYSKDPHSIYVMALALAYHDLALWVTVNATLGTKSGLGRLDYLDPSVELMKWDQAQLRQVQKANPDEFASPIPILAKEDLKLATEIILQHHKVTPWTTEGQGPNKEHSQKMEALVNAVRCADWADATLGVIRFGGLLSLDYMAYVYRQLPDAGFHETLGRMASRLSPTSWWNRLKLLRILKW